MGMRRYLLVLDMDLLALDEELDLEPINYLVARHEQERSEVVVLSLVATRQARRHLAAAQPASGSGPSAAAALGAAADRICQRSGHEAGSVKEGRTVDHANSAGEPRLHRRPVCEKRVSEGCPGDVPASNVLCPDERIVTVIRTDVWVGGMAMAGRMSRPRTLARWPGVSPTCGNQQFRQGGAPGEQRGVRGGQLGVPGGPVHVREPHPMGAFWDVHAARGPPHSPMSRM
jgi:hypothetical protein